MEADKQAIKLVKEFEQLKANRHNFENIWQDLTNYVMPRKNDFTVEKAEGQERNVRLYDTTATDAAERLASALIGFTCSPSEPWFNLQVDPTVEDDKDVQVWAKNAERLIYAVLHFPGTSFYPQVHELFTDLVVFGTSVMMIEEDSKDLIRFITVPLNQCFVRENHKGQVDSLYRYFCLDAEQALYKFPELGDEEIKEELQRKAEKSEKIWILHACYPQTEYRKSLYNDKSNMPFASVYVWKDKKVILRKSGYNEQAFSVARWSKLSGEVYGRSPAETALPDVRSLQALRKVLIRANQKSISPPLQVIHDSFIGQRINVEPDGINYIKSSYGNNQGIQPIEFGAKISTGMQEQALIRAQIQQTFMLDMLAEDKKGEMSATEAVQREQARMRVMAPQLGRLHSEFFGALIYRTYNILRRANLIPDPPLETDININYVSPLARSQALMEVSQLQSFMQQIIPYSQINPEVQERINTAKLLEIITKASKIDPSVLYTEEEFQQVMKAKKEQQEQMLMSQMAEQDSNSLKNLGQMVQMGRESSI